jgi:hypothetical protein
MASPLGLTLGARSQANKSTKYRIIGGKNVVSLFGPNNQFTPFPSGGGEKPFKVSSNIHGDDLYNLSIDEIVRYTQGDENKKGYPSMALTYSDFAYLKKVGSIPNNRLIVARRFQSPIGNDLTATNSQPMATLVSWVENDMIDIKFGEEWTDSEASFKQILNDIGDEFQPKEGDVNLGKLGDFAAGGMNVVPLRGFTEGLVYRVYEKLGITSKDNVNIPPLGNPNLIRESQMRKVIKEDSSGSGLKGKFDIKMKVEYEQKYIQGVDPSFVYLDIIQNALTFGTSDSYFQFNNKFADNTSEFITNLIKGDIVSIGKALVQFVNALIEAISQVGGDLVEKLKGSPKGDAAKKTEDQIAADKANIAEKTFSAIKDLAAKTIGNVIKKYKLKLLGVINSLTGTPSGPWHIMVGNPKRPILSTGDMICKGVDLKLGSILSFNDLPSSITLDIQFESARNLGAQEIFERFNTGKGRTYARRLKSSPESQDIAINIATQSSTGTQSFGTATGGGLSNNNNTDPYILTGNGSLFR